MATPAAAVVAVKGHSLRDRQIASIKQVLNLNDPLDQKDENESHANGLAPAGSILTSHGEPIWKVLVFDDLGRYSFRALWRYVWYTRASVYVEIESNDSLS